MNLFKNKFFIIAIVLVAIFLAIFFFTPAKEVETRKIKLGYMSGEAIHAGLPVLAAQEKGYFEEEGLDVEFVKINPGIVVPALLSGEIDYSSIDGGTIGAALEGAHLSTIAIKTSHRGLRLIAKPETNVEDIRLIGVQYYNTPAHYLALRVIEDYNLDADVIASEQTVVSMLVSNQVDAIVVQAFNAIKLTEQGYLNLGVFDEPITPGGLSVRKEILDENPGEVQKMVKAYQRGVDFILNGPSDEVIDLIIKHLDVEKNEENLEMATLAYPITVELFKTEGSSVKDGAKLLIQLSKVKEYTSLEDIRNEVVTQEEIDSILNLSFID